MSRYNVIMEPRAAGATRAIGGILPIAVASLLVLARGSLKPADLVLVLVLVVVGVAAFGDRVAAILAAVSAAASFDFFLTKPYGSLRVSSAQDIETTLILLVIGLAVGQIAIVGRTRRSEGQRAREELARFELVARSIADEPNSVTLVDLIEREIASTMSLATCHFTLVRPQLPELRNDGSVETSTHTFADGEFALPEHGVALAVVGLGQVVGWLELIPESTTGISLDSRKVAVALSQQLGAVLAQTRSEFPHG